MSARELKRIVLGLACVAIVVSCASQPAATAVPTRNPTPVSTPTPALPIVYLRNGGFSLAIQSGLDFEIDDSSILLFDQRGEHFISLHGRPYIASIHTLESFLGTYLDEVSGRGATFAQSDPYEIFIDGMSGTAIDLNGSFSEAPMSGMAVAVSPGKDFIIFGIGLSSQQRLESGGRESRSVVFDEILDSIMFLEGVKK
jgi:hypothetical protein